MHRSFLSSDRTHGARRVWHDVLAQGHRNGLHRIERLMRAQELGARSRRRRLPVDAGQRHAAAIAPNVLDRQFQASGPNRTWVAGLTYLWTAEGWLYVSVVLDLNSLRAVGWSMQNETTSQLVTDALMMSLWRCGKPNALLHHADRGSHTPAPLFSACSATWA